MRSTRDLPLETLLEPFGITLAPEPDRNAKPSLGARVRGGADCTLAAVHEGSAAQKAGLSAGDVLVAIDGLRVTGSNLDALLSRYLPGAKVEVHAFRRDELRTAQVKLDGPEVSRYTLSVDRQARGGAQLARALAGRLIAAKSGCSLLKSRDPGGGLFYPCNNPSLRDGFFAGAVKKHNGSTRATLRAPTGVNHDHDPANQLGSPLARRATRRCSSTS